MVQLKACPIKRDVVCLILCLIIFPISLRLALFGLMSCLICRIELDRNKHQKLIIKAIFGIVIAIATSRLYIESLSLIHPVSYYDYLLSIAVVGIIKHSPLSIKSISQICWAISFSPIIVFICSLSTLNFNVRNHWGFENPNWLGLYCSMCLPLTLCLLIKSLQRQSDSFNGQKPNLIPLGILTSVLVIICLMIVSSGSRSSFYTSLFISVIILWRSPMVNSISLLKHPKLRACLGGLLLGAILFYKLLLTRFAELSRFIDIANSTNIYRMKLYKCHLALGIEKPWVGWGMNRATVMCEQKLGAGEGGVNHAHNFILQMFVDWGLVITLLCLCVIFYFSVLPTLSLIAKPNFGSANDFLHLGISGSSMSILIASLFQSGFYHYPLFPIWLGLLWGCQLNLIEHQSCSSILAQEQPNSRSLSGSNKN